MARKDDVTVSEKTFAKYQIDASLSLPFFVILYLTVLHELRLIALSGIENSSAAEFPAFFTPNREAWIPDPLRPYFELSDKPVSLKENASESVLQALTKLLRAASEAFIADLKVKVDFAGLVEDHPLRYVEHVAKITSADKLLTDLLPEIVKYNPLIALENQISYDGDTPAIDLGDRDFRRHFIKEFTRFVSAGRVSLDPDGNGFSSDFPGIPVNSEALLKARHWGRIPVATGNDKGLYYVVRQARGRRTGDAPKVDIVVRDLLWLREYPAAFDEKGMRDPYKSPKKHGARLGYYFSTIDRQFFEVTNIAKRGDIIMLDAVAPLENDTTKSLCLYFPAIRHAGRVSLGNMIGSVEGRRTGAWTVVCFRPPEMSDEDERSLQLHLSVYSDVFHQMQRKPHYDNSSRLLNQLIEDRKLIGVLYSRLWADETEFAADADARNIETLDQRWKAFSSMFSRWEAYGDVDASNGVAAILDRVRDQNTGLVDEDRLREELLVLLQDEERHALTPPVTKDDPNRKSGLRDLDKDLTILAQRHFVPSYRAYLEASKGKTIKDLT